MTVQDLSYPQGFGGDPELLEALAAFFNRYFSPHVPVESAHVVAGPGATSCLSALLFGICNAGEAVIIPGSYWSENLLLLRTMPDPEREKS